MSDPIRFEPITALAELDPKTVLPPKKECSFIGMEDVSEEGAWVTKRTRSSREAAGYTPFHDGDVLFAKITPCMENGKGASLSGLVGGYGFGSTEFYVLRARPGTASGYLAQWARSPALRLKAEAFMTGSAGQRRVQSGFFREFAVPAFPLGEQRRIAEILDTADDAIRSTELGIAKLEQMKQGLLHDLLTRGIDEEGTLRDPIRDPGRFVDSAVGAAPSNWWVGRFGESIRLQRGFDITVADQRPGSVPVVSSSGISSYHDTAMVHGPGVVIGRKGKLGDAYYLEADFWPHDTTLWVTEFNANKPAFVALLLRSMHLERFDAATAVPTLNRNVVHPIPVAIPPPLEQVRILERIAAFDRAVDGESARLSKLRILKLGLSNDLLMGRVRVTVDEHPT